MSFLVCCYSNQKFWLAGEKNCHYLLMALFYKFILINSPDRRIECFRKDGRLTFVPSSTKAIFSYCKTFFSRFSRDRKNRKFKLPRKCLLKMTQNLEISTEEKDTSAKCTIRFQLLSTAIKLLNHGPESKHSLCLLAKLNKQVINSTCIHSSINHYQTETGHVKGDERFMGQSENNFFLFFEIRENKSPRK